MTNAKFDRSEREDFWAAVERSASLVKGAPKWTQAGLVLSGNYNGFEDVLQEPDNTSEEVEPHAHDARLAQPVGDRG